MKIQIPIFPNPHSRIRCQGWHNGNACSMIFWHLNISGTSKEKVSIRTEEGRMEAMNHLVNWGNKNRPCLPSSLWERRQWKCARDTHAGISHCPRLFFVAFNGCSHSPWSSQTEGCLLKLHRNLLVRGNQKEFHLPHHVASVITFERKIHLISSLTLGDMNVSKEQPLKCNTHARLIWLSQHH